MPRDGCPYETLDAGIRTMVQILREYGIETFESCQGGEGHTFPEPTVRFYGSRGEGFRAFAAARERGLSVYAIKRVWDIEDEEPTGPCWELTFREIDKAPGVD